jgi:hypothetical protein
MNDTDSLIQQLSTRAAPVRPLASPGLRTLQWTAASIAIIVFIALRHGLRPGLLAALMIPPNALEWGGSVLTGLFAAYAAFQVSVPGRSPSWAWLPLPPLMLWLSGLGWGCLRDFSLLGHNALVMEAGSWECAEAITMISLPLGFMLLMMVRHAGVVRPAPTALLVALSSAAWSAAGVDLFHNGENTLMVLLWHFGAVVVLSLACLAGGRQLFAWIGHRKY